jgi:uncharacterized protein (DUF1810 family)/inhibitor of KinA sporulation pathway (predicted exonuclease)
VTPETISPSNTSGTATPLDRFIRAQEGVYERALDEIRRGRKTSHWMWYIFPQLIGLGKRITSQRFGIRDLEEARAYLVHPVLGACLLECLQAVLDQQGTAVDIFGDTDARKLRSCVTLFVHADPAQPVFQQVLERFFDDRPDRRSNQMLGVRIDPSSEKFLQTEDFMSESELSQLIVIDFEATCDEPRNPDPQEVIEFPAVLIDVARRTVIGEFHRYVRPVAHPTLSRFCVDLTGIPQQQVDAADDFPTVLQAYTAWLTANDLGGVPVATCGDWDLGTLLPPQCRQHGLPIPDWARSWINVKDVFRRSVPGVRSMGLSGMLEQLGLRFEGRPHSGIDDTRNIARVVIALLGRDPNCLAARPAAPPAQGREAEGGDDIGKLLARLTPDCGKAAAQSIEFAVLDLAKKNPDALIAHAQSPAASHRECVAFVAGKLIERGLGTERLRQMLEALRRDGNSWVRKKAERALGR